MEVGECATEVAQCAKELQPTPPATSLFPGDNLEIARCGEGVEANLQDAGGPGGEFQDARGPSSTGYKPRTLAKCLSGSAHRSLVPLHESCDWLLTKSIVFLVEPFNCLCFGET